MTNNTYKWDLDSILEGDTIDSLFNKYVDQQTKLISLYPTFLDNEENFINFLNEEEKFTCLINRLSNYLTNNYQEDLANPMWISWLQKLNNQSIEFNKIFSDYDNKIIANKEKIALYLKNPRISDYTRQFELITRYAPHTLSKENELLLSQINIYNNSIDDIFSSLTDNDLKFDDAVNQKGEKIVLPTQADVFKHLRSKDETLRESTWYSFHKAFYNFRTTLTKCLYYNYLMLNTQAKLRHFDDYISQTAFNDEIDKEFINKLYNEITKYQPLVEKYQIAREKYLKRILNKNEIKPWDSYVELVESDKKYTIEETKTIALEALSLLGKEYQELVQKAFNERWISFLPSPNKQTGAYSIGGTKGLKKYFISMNFDSTIQSIYTLVHELGHSMNSYFYGQKQKIYQSTSIFHAEISSITNEMILSHYLLNKYKDDKEMKIMILDQIISGFFATTSRQIVFSNFEWLANDWVNNGEEFTYEKISSTYFDLIKKYLYVPKDKEVFAHEPYSLSLITPLRVGHFYVGNFYVYKYCIGQIAAVIISNEIINNAPGAKEKLFNFLSSGTSLNPLDTIKLLGIDLQNLETYNQAQNILNDWIDEFVKLVNE